MIKYIVTVLLLICLIYMLGIAPATADSFLAEVNEVVIKQVETSALVGNTGAALGVFWPIKNIEELNIDVGPMGAVGNEAMIGGVGAQLPVSVTIGGFEVPVNFLYGGIAYYFGESNWGVAAGGGKAFEVKF